MSEDRYEELRKLCKDSPLTRDDERALAYRMRLGDQDARDKLITSNLRLVWSIAKHFGTNGNLEDVIFAGIGGLIRAVDHYNPDKGFRVCSYAGNSIRHAIQNSLPDNYTVRLPTYQITMRNRIHSIIHAHMQKTGDEPSNELIVAKLVQGWPDEYKKASFTPERIAECRAAHERTQPTSLGELEITLTAQQPETEESHSFELSTVLQDALSTALTPREYNVIRHRFGIGVPQENLDSVGKRLNLTRERVRQIEQKALQLLNTKPRFRRLYEALA
jgi:RNA polymerase primary sigma factor